MNENRFTGLADIYAKYRPSYPVEFIRYLYTEVGLTKDSVVADIGAGTGILTELLLREGSTVYGVEPNEDMRHVAENALARYPHFISMNGTAENTGLRDTSVHFITVAQAFHWFDREKFKDECRRVLKLNGKVILVWNSRDVLSAFVLENDVVNRRYCPDFAGYSGGMRGGSPDEYADFFKGGVCDFREFRNDVAYDEEGFIGRNLSGSYAPKKGDESYTPFVAALKELYEKYSHGGVLVMPNLTRSFIGEV